MRTRLSRAEQVERNREAVLEAARGVFLEHGYPGASLEMIATAAGFSKGVVYSQFESKADLFLALLGARIAERAGDNARLARECSGPAGVIALIRHSARNHAEERWHRLRLEFRLVAARDPVLNRRYADLHEQALDGLADVLTDILARGGFRPYCPPRVLAELFFALEAGVALERAVRPAALPPRHLEDLVSRLVEPA